MGSFWDFQPQPTAGHVNSIGSDMIDVWEGKYSSSLSEEMMEVLSSGVDIHVSLLRRSRCRAVTT